MYRFAIVPLALILAGVFRPALALEEVVVPFDCLGTHPCYGGLSLVQGSDGLLYGQAQGESGGGMIYTSTLTGEVDVLYDWSGPTDSPEIFSPRNSLMAAADGNLYGAARSQSDSDIFRIVPGQAPTLLADIPFDDGEVAGPPVEGDDGNFYGILSNDFSDDGNCGNFFRMTPAGVVTPLHEFECVTLNDSLRLSRDGIVKGNDGNFYGTTGFGGEHGRGSVFRITPSGALATLHSFVDVEGPAGAYPHVGLTLAADGNFYGITFGGRFHTGVQGWGTIFRMTPAGTVTPVFTFSRYDGEHVPARMVEGSDGALYGTTEGSTYGNRGSVFRLTTDGVLTMLHRFTGDHGLAGDGAYPLTGVVQASDGKFYGTTWLGGTDCPDESCPSGVLYRVDGQPELSAAPMNVTARAGHGKVTLDWTQSAGAHSYLVYLRDATGARLAGAYTAPPVTVDNLTPGTEYDFYVVADDSSCTTATCNASFGKTSAPSGIVSATPKSRGGALPHSLTLVLAFMALIRRRTAQVDLRHPCRHG